MGKAEKAKETEEDCVKELMCDRVVCDNVVCVCDKAVCEKSCA